MTVTILAAAEAQRGFGGPLGLLAGLAVFGLFYAFKTMINNPAPPPWLERWAGNKTAGQKVADLERGQDPEVDVDLDDPEDDGIDPNRVHTGFSVRYNDKGQRMIIPRYEDEEPPRIDTTKSRL